MPALDCKYKDEKVIVWDVKYSQPFVLLGLDSWTCFADTSVCYDEAVLKEWGIWVIIPHFYTA